MVRQTLQQIKDKARRFMLQLQDMITRGYFNPRSSYEIDIEGSTRAQLKKYIQKVQKTISRISLSSLVIEEQHWGGAIYHGRRELGYIPIIRETISKIKKHYNEEKTIGNNILTRNGYSRGLVRIKVNYILIIGNEAREFKSHNIRSERHLLEIINGLQELPSVQRAYATSFQTIVFPTERAGLDIDIDEGGSNNLSSSHRDLKTKAFIPLDDTLMIVNLLSVRSSNNNCLIESLRRISKFKRTAKTIRNLLDIKQGIMLSTNYIEILCRGYFKDIESVRVRKIEKGAINKITNIYTYGEPNPKYRVELCLMDNHFYLIKEEDDIIIHKDVSFSKKRDDWYCKKCSNIVRGKHRCPKNKVSYFKRKRRLRRMKEKEPEDNRTDFIEINEDIQEVEFNLKRMLFFDMETFNNGKEHIPYAIGWIDMEDRLYHKAEGKDCLERFVKYLLTKRNKYICAYNGAGFDFRFILNELDKQNIEIKNPIIANNSILHAKFGNFKTPNVLWDICRFTLSSLKKAGKSFNLKIEKGDFNHELIKSWEDVEKYKYKQPDGLEGWKPYLKKDVLVLKDLFIAFNNKMYDVFKIYPVDYMTLSSMTYDLWKRYLPVNRDFITDKESDIQMSYTEKEYNFVRSSVYGGRTYLYNMFFQSKNYDLINDINNTKLGEEKIEELKQMYKKIYNENDFIYNGDVNSLYPASMVNHYYPTGKCRWSNKPEEEFKNGKLGCYEVEVFCSNSIKVPVIPVKENNGLRWKTGNLKGVYNSVDIQNCLDFGYKVNFVGECLVWDKKRKDVFTEFIKKCYELKKEAKINGDKVLYSISKLLMNALYGKMLQRAFRGSIEFCKTLKDFINFERENFVDNWIVLNENTMLMIGEKKDFAPCIRKPNYLGSFILGYSRSIMLNLFSKLSPKLNECPFTYTDTDSLHITGDKYKHLLKNKLIDDNKLGFCSNDIDEGGLIIKEINIAPKVYMYEYLTEKGEIRTTMKCKGIPKQYLFKEYYTEKEMRELKLYKEGSGGRLKKISIKTISKSDINEGLSPLSIVVRPMTRTFNKTKWKGAEMDIKNNKVNFFHQD